MSTPMVLCDNFNIIFSNQRAATRSKSFYSVHSSSSSSFLVVPHLINGKIREKKRFCGLIPNAKKKHKRSWWQRFFFDEEGNWFGLKDDDMIDIEEYSQKSSGDDESEEERELSEGEKFEAWKRRAEAIIELREAQEDMRNQENRNWEDWIIANDGNNGNTNNGRSSSSWVVEEDWTDINNGGVRKSIEEDPTDILISSGRGLVQSVRDLILGIQDDEDLLYEDRIFRYASFNSAKFLAVLIIVPWALDFLVHDYILMPFLDRYVRTVPLAAQMLDVRRQQKIEMAKELKLEKARYRLEVEIGKSPPLSEEDLWLELRHKTLELRDEWRLENRRAFANIWSDMVFGVSLFILLYFNQSRVALLKFTGYKIINNISDSGKAFLIILVTDIFLGYHSESGWKTLLEIIVEHYGLEVDSSSITIFVCLVPVVIDACVKLWMFKFLPRLSPKVANIFREMKRH